ncbi:nuclear transport factor 2 family protein [Novosphingobium bradum]|uniref:Nuclear transport factor 2 family protein n=1 Tax=Novosphingobium bradum TaxID=1737444 RepID=A0ABV7IK94_9SPHN
MTLEELIARESIRDTLAVVSRAGDHLDVEAYVGSFTPDGLLEYGTRLHNAGREAIRAWMEGARRHADKRGLIRHNVTSTCIELTGPVGAPTGAQVRSYYHVYTGIGPDHFGWYEDRFEPCEGRWLLAHRAVGVDWVSPESRFAPRQ